MEVLSLRIHNAEDVSLTLAESDALLSAVRSIHAAPAGIACGLPIIGYAAAANGTPLEEAV